MTNNKNNNRPKEEFDNEILVIIFTFGFAVFSFVSLFIGTAGLIDDVILFDPYTSCSTFNSELQLLNNDAVWKYSMKSSVKPKKHDLASCYTSTYVKKTEQAVGDWLNSFGNKNSMTQICLRITDGKDKWKANILLVRDSADFNSTMPFNTITCGTGAFDINLKDMNELL